MQSRSLFQRSPRRPGFTLIELLVAISVIAVLASISLPLYQRSMATTRRIKGVSNLRQVGAGCMAYATDHDATLPGPCPLGVIPTYYKNDAQNLGAYLAPYLGLPDPATVTNSAKPQVVSILVSPGLIAVNPATASLANRIPHYIQGDILKGNTTTGGTGTIRPFGDSAYNVSALKLTRLGDFVNAVTNLPMNSTQAWLLTDVDQQTTDSPARASGWFSSLPLKPVYGDRRVRVYADGHAEAALLTDP